jgi:hypothetical protein
MADEPEQDERNAWVNPDTKGEASSPVAWFPQAERILRSLGTQHETKFPFWEPGKRADVRNINA